MGLTNADWNAIYNAIQRAIPPSEIVYGKVVKRDERKKLIWLKEFGDQPIPLVAFNNTVTVYDETPVGVVKKTMAIDIEVPKVGELAVVLREMGSRRLPKCVGIVQSKGYVV